MAARPPCPAKNGQAEDRIRGDPSVDVLIDGRRAGGGKAQDESVKESVMKVAAGLREDFIAVVASVSPAAEVPKGEDIPRVPQTRTAHQAPKGYSFRARNCADPWQAPAAQKGVRRR